MQKNTGFPGVSDCNALPAMQGTWAQSPGWGRSPREGNGYPRQYPCLQNSMDRGVPKIQTHHGHTRDTGSHVTIKAEAGVMPHHQELIRGTEGFLPRAFRRSRVLRLPASALGVNTFLLFQASSVWYLVRMPLGN